MKTLMETSPADWPVLAGYPRGEVAVVDADVSAVSGGADKVPRVRDDPDWLMHLEFQRGPDYSLPQRTHMYNGILEVRHGLMVRSVIVLLSPRANLTNLTEVNQRQFKGETPYLTFRYQVIRVWERPADTFLKGGLALVTLAPISAVSDEHVPAVIEQMKVRIDAEAGPALKKDLWAATYILLGLRFDSQFINQLLKGVIEMEESTTYQYILEKGAEKGAIKEARQTLLRQGTKKFGLPEPAAKAQLEGIEDLDRLHDLELRILDVPNWQELLG